MFIEQKKNEKMHKKHFGPRTWVHEQTFRSSSAHITKSKKKNSSTKIPLNSFCLYLNYYLLNSFLIFLQLKTTL